MAKLTDKQDKFCTEYLVDLNATQAAIRSGYSEHTAQEIGSQNLSKLIIQDRIAELRLELRKTAVTPEKIIAEYAKIAFFNPKRLFDAKGDLLPIHKMDDDVAAAIAGLDISTIKRLGNDEEALVEVIKKLKYVDKRGSLDSLSKIQGLFIDKLALTDTEGKDISLAERLIRTQSMDADAINSLLKGSEAKE